MFNGQQIFPGSARPLQCKQRPRNAALWRWNSWKHVLGWRWMLSRGLQMKRSPRLKEQCLRHLAAPDVTTLRLTFNMLAIYDLRGWHGFLGPGVSCLCLDTFGRGSNKRSNEMWSPCCNWHNSPGPNKGCDSVARVYHSGGQGSWSVEMCHVFHRVSCRLCPAALPLPLPFPASPTTTTALPKKPDGRSRRSRSPEDRCCAYRCLSIS